MEAACTVGETVENGTEGLESLSAVSQTGVDVENAAPVDIKVEVCVQANDYEIERATGNLPARKRFIPVKFRDFCSLEAAEEDNHDDDYLPETEISPSLKKTSTEPGKKRGRGRPRKQPEGEASDPPKTTPRMIKTTNGYKCSICNHVFSQKGNLKVHLITHTDDRPFPCDVEECKKSFRTKESLRRHKLSHFGIKPFECEECKQKFCSALSLQEHVSRHTDARPYKCDTCSRSFRQISCLRRHLVTHSQEQPHECNKCHRRFSQAIYLRSHMKVHTGEKPFTCDQCNKAFAHASDLTRHKIIHTGEKPYACSKCKMRFSDPSSRRRHEREHLGAKPYACHLCPEGFKRAGQLRVHLFRRHGLKEGVEYHIQGAAESVHYRIELRDAPEGRDGTTASSTLIAKNIDLSSIDQKKIMSLIQNLNPSLVVQEIQMSTPEGDGAALASEVVAADKDGVAAGDLDQVVVPAEVAAIMETGDTSAAGSVITIQEVGPETEGGEVMTTYQILAGEVEGSEQQIYEVHYQPVTDVDHNPDNKADTQSADNTPSETVSTVTVGNSSATAVTSVSPASTATVTTTATSNGVVASSSSSSSSSTTPPLQSSPDYVSKPDFGSQEYFNWLSDFTETCKLVPIPLEVDLFQKISQVHKTLSDFMASPSGVITDKENFRILMSISKDLNYILNEHLTYMLLNLSDGESTQKQTS